MTLEHQDYLGKKIEVGDTVVYPVRKFSNLWLSKTKVIELCYHHPGYGPPRSALKVEGKTKTWDNKERPYVRTVTRLDRVIVVEKGDNE